MLEVGNIRKFLDQKQILHSLSFSTKDNGIIGILGPNGSGKTTLFRILASLMKPDSGTLVVDGHNLRKMDCTVVFESARCFNLALSVKENYRYWAALKGIDPNAIDEIIETDANYGLAKKLWKNKVGTLSVGEKQILVVLATLLTDSPILCLDEPSNGLDITNLQLLKDIILQQRENRLILVSSHDVSFIQEIADRVFIFSQGTIVREVNNRISYSELSQLYASEVIT
ncbi:ABC transporter ATP-binding protein [uncultured Sphaerochaeta sp.]|uniref:ABC transporter ATP-binding protein n=1 Tax=uncultured Sphaerochaeta sp. TaxID=886478 RepID=UPI002A0A3A43|nr:ABC transporter ATP-binding protein [uncultured Sphaerochaeta sp.]